jgi:ubiquinone/menaquinone biosynthesis C-methylase UbiE
MSEFSKEQRHAVERAIMTERELNEYKDYLSVSDEELEHWDTVVDLGSGTQQEFARAMKKKYPDKTVYSVDARLTLGEQEDLEGMLPEEAERRLEGRNNPVEGTIAAFAQKLPIESESVDAVLASFSIPMYTETQDEIDKAFDEAFRILKPRGEARFYPVSKNKNLYMVLEWLDRTESQGGMHYDLVLKEKIDSVGEEKYLAIVYKEEAGIIEKAA